MSMLSPPPPPPRHSGGFSGKQWINQWSELKFSANKDKRVLKMWTPSVRWHSFDVEIPAAEKEVIKGTLAPTFLISLLFSTSPFPVLLISPFQPLSIPQHVSCLLPDLSFLFLLSAPPCLSSLPVTTCLSFLPTPAIFSFLAVPAWPLGLLLGAVLILW